MENKLLKGWEYPLLGEVIKITSGNSKLTKKKYVPDAAYTAFSGSGPDGKTDFFEHEGEAIILSAVGARCGKCFKAEGKWTAIANTSIIRLKKEDKNIYRYLFYMFNNENFWPRGGTGQPFVKTGIAQKELRIPFPPIDEQKLIADKLDILLTKVKDAQSLLDKIPQILKRFRQSILAAAFSGKFIETEYDEKIIDNLGIKIQTGPFGSTLHKSDYVEGGIPVINPMHIVDSKIRPSEKVTVNKNTFQRLRNYVLQEGDILLARRGEMGRCAVVDADSEGYLCGTGSLFLRFDKEKIDPYYLQMILSSPPSVNYLSGNSVGTTMQNLNQSILKEMTIPLPSLPEQQKVVHKARGLFDMVRVIETRYLESRKYTDKLEQSILAKAFQGELVSQKAE